MQSSIEWPYSAPNMDGTCNSPNTQMLITNTAPGTCVVDTLGPPYTCKQPDPYNNVERTGFHRQSNKDYAICAPSCSPTLPCPAVGADPVSGKNIQGLPVCTAYENHPNPGPNQSHNIGHCVITSPLHTSDAGSKKPQKHFEACDKIGGDNMGKVQCDVMAHSLHLTPADNMLHINDKSACEQNYTNFLNNTDEGHMIKNWLESDQTTYSKWLLNPSNWCTVDPVYPHGTYIDGTPGSANLGQCDIKQGTLPSTCSNVDCKATYEFDEFSCRKANDCCQWYLHTGPNMASVFSTGYYPINKLTPRASPRASPF